MNTQQQAYIEGFVKRAAEYGLNSNEAVDLLNKIADNKLNTYSLPQENPPTPLDIPLKKLVSNPAPRLSFDTPQQKLTYSLPQENPPTPLDIPLKNLVSNPAPRLSFDTPQNIIPGAKLPPSSIAFTGK